MKALRILLSLILCGIAGYCFGAALEMDLKERVTFLIGLCSLVLGTKVMWGNSA